MILEILYFNLGSDLNRKTLITVMEHCVQFRVFLVRSIVDRSNRMPLNLNISNKNRIFGLKIL